MKVSEDFYPSKYLAADDLKGKQVRLTISHVERQEFNDGQVKPVISFTKAKKSFVSNRTNTFEIVGAYGDETDNWVGKDLLLQPARVPFQGKMVNAVRVSIPETSTFPPDRVKSVAPKQKELNPPPREVSLLSDELNDEIDF